MNAAAKNEVFVFDNSGCHDLVSIIEAEVSRLRGIARETARTLDILLSNVARGMRERPPREWVQDAIARIADADARADELQLFLTTPTSTGTMRMPSLRGLLP